MYIYMYIYIVYIILYIYIYIYIYQTEQFKNRIIYSLSKMLLFIVNRA